MTILSWKAISHKIWSINHLCYNDVIVVIYIKQSWFGCHSRRLHPNITEVLARVTNWESECPYIMGCRKQINIHSLWEDSMHASGVNFTMHTRGITLNCCHIWKQFSIITTRRWSGKVKFLVCLSVCLGGASLYRASALAPVLRPQDMFKLVQLGAHYTGTAPPWTCSTFLEVMPSVHWK